MEQATEKHDAPLPRIAADELPRNGAAGRTRLDAAQHQMVTMRAGFTFFSVWALAAIGTVLWGQHSAPASYRAAMILLAPFGIGELALLLRVCCSVRCSGSWPQHLHHPALMVTLSYVPMAIGLFDVYLTLALEEPLWLVDLAATVIMISVFLHWAAISFCFIHVSKVPGNGETYRDGLRQLLASGLLAVVLQATSVLEALSRANTYSADSEWLARLSQQTKAVVCGGMLHIALAVVWSGCYPIFGQTLAVDLGESRPLASIRNTEELGCERNATTEHHNEGERLVPQHLQDMGCVLPVPEACETSTQHQPRSLDNPQLLRWRNINCNDIVCNIAFAGVTSCAAAFRASSTMQDNGYRIATLAHAIFNAVVVVIYLVRYWLQLGEGGRRAVGDKQVSFTYTYVLLGWLLCCELMVASSGPVELFWWSVLQLVVDATGYTYLILFSSTLHHELEDEEPGRERKAGRLVVVRTVLMAIANTIMLVLEMVTRLTSAHAAELGWPRVTAVMGSLLAVEVGGLVGSSVLWLVKG